MLSGLGKFHIYVVVSLKLEMKISLPGCYTRSRKIPSQYRFTILSLIVPAYSYSCGLRALIEAMRSTEIITLRSRLNIRFLYS